MTSPRIVRHNLSRTSWYDMGAVPGTTMHVFAGPVGGDHHRSHFVDRENLTFYEEVPPALKEHATYTSKNTGATIYVEHIFKNPDDGELVAFGWRKLHDNQVVMPVTIMEKAFGNYTEKNA